MTDTTLTLTLNDRDEAVQLFGNRDQFLRLIRDALNVRIIARGETIQIDGDPAIVEQADRVAGRGVLDHGAGVRHRHEPATELGESRSQLAMAIRQC